MLLLSDMAYNLRFFTLLKHRNMKTMKLNIAGLFLASGLIMNSIGVYAQQPELTREEKKEIRKAQIEANFNALDSLLNSRRFVLVADFLENKYGERVPVIQTLNFIKVDETKGVLQTGSATAIGYNGVGGVTAEGNLDDIKITKNFKSHSYTMRFSITTQIGHYDVLMTVNAANNASATITGTTPGKLIWVGHLESLGFSRVFKGQNSI
jgi:Domain of unknown function (DUF4251)